MSAVIVVLMAVIAAPATYFVRGVVRGPDGQPVGEADVWLFDRLGYFSPDGPPEARATTDASGRFALALPANAPFSRNYAFDVFTHKRGTGMAAATVDARLLPVQTLTLKMEASAPVELRVVDPDGKPVRDASVKVVNFSDVALRGNYWLPITATGHPFTRRTDAQGEVTFELCDPLRSLFLTVEGPGYGTQMLSRGNDGSNPPLRLGRVGKLRGRLIGDNPKITAGALIQITTAPVPPDAAQGWANVRTNAEGRFEVPAISAGEVRVVSVEHAAGSPIFLEKEVRATLQAGGASELEVPLIRGVRVYGTVIEVETSKPLAAAPVHVLLNRGSVAIAKRPVLTDSKGRYEVYVTPGAGPGVLQFGPLPEPWLPAHSGRVEFDVPPGADELAVPDFVVRRGITLTGTVVDLDSRPVPLARVQAAAVDADKSHYQRVLAETDAKGKFSIGPVDPDMVLALTASDDTRASRRILTLEPWQTKGSIDLIIEAAAMAQLSGRIVDSDRKPIVDAIVQAGPDMGSANWEHAAIKALLPISYVTARTDQEGKYVLPNRVPRLGRYYIQINCSGYVVKRLPLYGPDLSPGQQTLEDLTLEREEKK